MSLVTSQSNCQTNQAFVKIFKKNLNYAAEESFQILNGQTVLYTSPNLVNQQTQEFQTCITASENH